MSDNWKYVIDGNKESDLYNWDTKPFGKDVRYVDENYKPCEFDTAVAELIWDENGLSHFIPVTHD